MGYTHEARFKKHFGLERVWNMSVQDICEISGLDFTDLQEVYLRVLGETRSRATAINETCGYALHKLFPHKKYSEDTNGRRDP
jgi:hypothetical protein